MVKRGKVINPIRSIAILAVVVFLLHLIFIFTGWVNINVNLFGNLFSDIVAFLAFISMFLLYRKFPEYFPMEKKAKLFLLISLSLFFLGDLIWTLEQVIEKNILPIGGIPDLCWNLAYFSLGGALIFFMKTEFRKSNLWPIIITSLGVVAGSIYLFVSISEDLNLGIFSFIHLIQTLYVFYDILIFALGLIILYPLIISRNKLFLGWMVLGLGVMTRLIHDALFENLSESGAYYTGHPVDLIYVLFYISIIFNSLIKFNLLNKK